MNGNPFPPEYPNIPSPQPGAYPQPGFAQPEQYYNQGAPMMQPNPMQGAYPPPVAPPFQTGAPNMLPPREAVQYPTMMPNGIPPTEMAQYTTMSQTKFCPTCGSVIPAAAVICTNCGCQAGQLQQPVQPVVQPVVMYPQAGAYRKPKDKWVAFFLCLFLGVLGVHKYYEGKVGLGLLYMFTGGLFGIGWLIDLIVLLFKSNPYFDY